MLYCRFAWIIETVLTMTCSASSSSDLTPFWLSAQEGEDSLSHASEGSPFQPLPYGDRSCVNTKHQADPIWIRPAPIDPPLPGVEPPVVYGAAGSNTPCLPRGTETRPPPSWRWGEHSGPLPWAWSPPKPPESVPWSPAQLWSLNRGKPVRVDQPRGEPLFRELIHKPADSPLNV
jgi:hypothetical protein